MVDMNYVKMLLLLSLVFVAAPAADDHSLIVGDDAPKLAVETWLKGDAVKSFEKGQIYVLEFWATWCGPCIAVIPHLTKLQKEHKGVTFIGVNVWEENRKKPADFVKKMGDKMDYRVAIQDGTKMESTWLTPAAQDGIPCSFIIDKEGKVAWIGHPMGLDEVLKPIIAGTFDAKAEAKKAMKMEAIESKLAKAMRSEDWDAAITQLDQLVDASGDDQYLIMKFQLLLQQKEDPKAAYELAKSFPERFKDDSEALNEASWFIVDEPGLKRRDLKLAKKMAKMAVDLTERKAAHIIDTLARVYFEEGDSGTAIKLQDEAIAAVAEGDDRMKADLKKTLQGYINKSAL